MNLYGLIICFIHQIFFLQTVKHSNEPDLMEFFTTELQKEQGEFSLPGLSTPSESLSTASHFRAFDLYRHNRVWDNNSYFSVKKK